MMTRSGPVFRLWICGWTIWLLSGCGGLGSLEDVRCEGEAQIRRLTAELRELHTKDEIQKSLPQLRKRFNQIADLLIEVRSFPKEEGAMSDAGEELFLELARLYEIAGGRELIESAQNEALLRLGAESKALTR